MSHRKTGLLIIIDLKDHKAIVTGLLGRFASTDEVANMVVYACSEQGSTTSGAALRVDGGVVMFAA